MVDHDQLSPSHLESSSASVGRPGNCPSPVLAVENVDVRQSILLDISLDGIHVSQFRSSSRSHTFYLNDNGKVLALTLIMINVNAKTLPLSLIGISKPARVSV